MQTTSTTQRLRLKIQLSLIIFVISLVSSSTFAQVPNGTRCFTGPNIGCATCMLGYPDNSNLPRSAVIFNESEVLRAADPGPATCGSAPTTIKAWYNDEHALTLGVRRVIVKTNGNTQTHDFVVTPTPTSGPICVTNPEVGSTHTSGDLAGTDVADGGGRPMYPAMFITDLTVNGNGSRAGDWQYGGTAVLPHRVCGTWKGAVRTVDKTVSPNKITITPDADPAKNDWNLGGGEPPPAGTTNQGYGALVTWNVADLGLLPGHTYRLQFMVHDGDQNKTGGDVGQSCTTIIMPGGSTNTSTVTPRATTTWTTVGSNIVIRTTLNKPWVDNTYGTNAIGWTGGHTFMDLVNSDFLRLALYDSDDKLKYDIKMDYLSASNTVASGYTTLGYDGGDGDLIKGSDNNIISIKTSLSENLNTYGYVLTSNSPATNSSYAPNPTYPNWIYDVWYEVTIKSSAFGGAGFGYPELPGVHASPNKAGSSEAGMVPAACPTNLVSLGNLVWDDKNNNGIKNLDEPGVNGAVVNLYMDANNDNVPDGAAVATTSTDLSGFYHFNNIAGGTYIVGVVLPYNTSMGLSNLNDPDNDIDNDNNSWQLVGSEVRSKAITLLADTEPTNDGDDEDANQTLDFAIVVNYGAVGDYVWMDDNGNGRQDVNEAGVPNVIARLYTCAGVLIATTATDVLGEYIFINVPATTAGTSYKVQFSNLPANYEFTFPNRVGVPTDQNSKPNRTTGFTDCFTLHAGEANMDMDAGIFIINIVPVTLSKFQGIYTGSVVKLNWSTTNEFNFDHYEIERSTDASNFSNIGRVSATGGTGDNYSFNDVSPLAGANYYRLKIVDRNGYAKYTNIILINVSIKGLAIGGTYPSPFKDNVTLNISSDAAQGVVIKVVDVAGKTVLTEIRQLQAGSNAVNIDKLGALSAGAYLLKIKAGDETKTTKLVKE